MYRPTTSITFKISKIWIVADLEGFNAVRLEVRRLPDLPDLPSGDPCRLSHKAHAPMSGLLGNLLNGHGQNLFDPLARKFLGLP